MSRAVPLTISASEARLAHLSAQGLVGAPRERRSRGLVAQVGAVQLDTISVLARSHELVAYSRLGPIGRVAVESMLWGGETFEYWAHAACVLPLADWPLFAPRRAVWRARVKESNIPVSVFKD